VTLGPCQISKPMGNDVTTNNVNYYREKSILRIYKTQKYDYLTLPEKNFIIMKYGTRCIYFGLMCNKLYERIGLGGTSALKNEQHT